MKVVYLMPVFISTHAYIYVPPNMSIYDINDTHNEPRNQYKSMYYMKQSLLMGWYDNFDSQQQNTNGRQATDMIEYICDSAC